MNAHPVLCKSLTNNRSIWQIIKQGTQDLLSEFGYRPGPNGGYKERAKAARELAEKNGTFNMRNWAKTKVIPLFIVKFPNTDKEIQEKVHNWFKNNCKRSMPISRFYRSERAHASSLSPENAPEHDDGASSNDDVATPPSHRLRGLREMVAEEYKTTILSRIHGSNNAKLRRQEFIGKWNAELTRFISELPKDTIQYYEAAAERLRDQSKTTQTKEDILMWQKHLPVKAGLDLHKLLGWGRRQYGDGLFFVATAYREPSNKVFIKKWLISNVPQDIESDSFMDAYDEHISDHFRSLADNWLPRHNKGVAPLLTQSLSGKHIIRPFDVDSVTRNEMKEVVSSYLTKLWEVSGRSGTLPWSSLEDPTIWKSYLLDIAPLANHTNINPATMPGESIIALAEALSKSPGIIDFGRTSTLNTTHSSPPQEGSSPHPANPTNDDPFRSSPLRQVSPSTLSTPSRDYNLADPPITPSSPRMLPRGTNSAHSPSQTPTHRGSPPPSPQDPSLTGSNSSVTSTTTKRSYSSPALSPFASTAASSKGQTPQATPLRQQSDRPMSIDNQYEREDPMVTLGKDQTDLFGSQQVTVDPQPASSDHQCSSNSDTSPQASSPIESEDKGVEASNQLAKIEKQHIANASKPDLAISRTATQTAQGRKKGKKASAVPIRAQPKRTTKEPKLPAPLTAKKKDTTKRKPGYIWVPVDEDTENSEEPPARRRRLNRTM